MTNIKQPTSVMLRSLRLGCGVLATLRSVADLFNKKTQTATVLINELLVMRQTQMNSRRWSRNMLNTCAASLLSHNVAVEPCHLRP